MLAKCYLKQNIVSFHCKVETGQPNSNFDSLRITSGILGWCLVVFCATYTGNLIASLTGSHLCYLCLFFIGASLTPYYAYQLNDETRNRPFCYLFFRQTFFYITLYCMLISVTNPKIPLQSLHDLSVSDKYLPLIVYGSVSYDLFKVKPETY